MKTYKVDTKETIWYRSEYQVEDDVTPEELYRMIENGEEASEYEGYMVDTAQQMSVEEDNGHSTIEILVNTDKYGWMPIWGNGSEIYDEYEEGKKD